MTPRPIVCAAQYLRMSTERQTYSIPYQTAANAAYALEHGYQIVVTYADDGVSGLTLARRSGLQSLLADVIAARAGFDVVLVYDVSRWGRFQDPDESAHYEFLCRAAGVRVEYTGEAFANDGSLAAQLLKQLKRTMAAEFSRELSDKIIRSKRRIGLDGYWPGGNPGIGLRRKPIAADDAASLTLEPGQRNAIKGRRVVVVPGPAGEVATVRRIFDLCVSTRLSPNGIAKVLNAEDRPDGFGRPWTQRSIRRVLGNELYVGTRILGRASVRLGQCKRNPPDQWIRVAGAGEAIIPLTIFRKAQGRLAKRPLLTDAQLDDALRSLLARTGHLSHNAIARDPATPSPSVYRHRFGNLANAYARVDYEPTPDQRRLTELVTPHRSKGRRPSPSPLPDDEVILRLQALRAQHDRLDIELIEITSGLPRVRNLLRRFGSMCRVYELAGHVPTARQMQGFARKRRATTTPP